ncbi:SGNH hydrolase-type esterase domain-containing protein [Gamsiella multidivaricata]|uniref:SGNH hydrolase-type esterase domain-containing protein n=1 Tax=Gamsiella multidivaricata TaxID=101098 RepID=UPI002220ABC6|nr:SGNH hydrolase-type esterase domain-containing protein [Gamsiella multidivaricata]KAI7824691.1 SGNH hydrolase-type esterase domain-containing protein [Gamsiella multidivaricata]
MEFIRSFFRTTKVFFTICFFYLKLIFIYLSRWYEPSLRTKGSYNHAIVVIGDDHALGVGDYSTITAGSGIAHKLSKELAKEVSIRQSWQIFNRGEYKTSTEDWLLPADSKRLEKPELLARLLQDPKYLRAEIVIIMLGSYDVLQRNPSLTPQDTLRNLELICQALKRTGKEGKSIYLCTIPTAGDDIYLTEQQRVDKLARNRLIEEYVKKNDDGVLPGLQIDLASNFEMKRKNLYWQNGRHFSEIGYTKMAKDWVPVIRPDMVKREFALFRSDLGL